MHQKMSVSSEQQNRDIALPTVESSQLKDTIKKLTDAELKSALHDMFDHRSEYVAELEDKAKHIGDRSKIYEAMRLARLKKTSIQADFYALYSDAYNRQFLSNHKTGLSISDYFYTDQANGQSAMQNEVLEIRAAIDQISDKIKRKQWKVQSSITKRFSMLTGHTYDVNNFPISAWLICEAFAEVVRQLDTPLSRKLIILKMFECSVVPRLEQLYVKVDELLIADGVMQVIKNDSNTGDIEASDDIDMVSISRLSEFEDQLNSVSKSELDFNVKRFVSMQQMLHGDNDANASPATTHSPADANSEAAAAVYSMDEVITALSVLQEKVLMLEHKECVAINSNIMPHLIKMLHVMDVENVGRELDRTSSDVIDIVSMMFDFILDDDSLPLNLRAVIIRLQIPMTKVAILDNDFFNSRLQPARQLLNELAYSANAMQLIEKNGNENAILNKVERVTEGILRDFIMNVDMFESELRNFQQFMRTVLKKRKEKTRQLQITKDKVVAEIKARLTNQKVPPVVEVFIKEVWNNVITKVGLRTNCAGATWREILKITDDLIWSTQPKSLLQEKQLLIKMIPKLLGRLQKGLSLIKYSKVQIDQFLQHMEDIHLNSLKGVWDSGDTNMELSLKDSTRAYLYTGKSLSNNTSMVSAQSHLTQTGNFDSKTLKAFSQGFSDSDPMLSPSYITVSEMSIGTWVEFSMDNRVTVGKLEWKCDFTGEFRFVDRNYTVICSLSLQKLVRLFDQNKARIIEDIPLFDRAVDAVYHGLQAA